MAIARRDIVAKNSSVHAYFRCHDRNYFFRPAKVKRKILELIAKNKAKYLVQIFDFNFMDNHVHLYMQAPDADVLGAFMRTVESQISRFVNRLFQRDSQAIRERYKSPIVSDFYYAHRLVKYIYANRYAVDKSTRPDQDFWCSAYWRIHKPYKLIENPKSVDELNNNLMAKLLDDYKEPGLLKLSKKRRFTQTLVDEAIRECDSLENDKAFSSAHTLGQPDVVAYRAQLLSCSKRQTGPPGEYQGSIAFGGSRALIKLKSRKA